VPIWHLDSTEGLQLWEGVASTRVERHWVECFLIFDGGLYGITFFCQTRWAPKQNKKKEQGVSVLYLDIFEIWYWQGDPIAWFL